MSKFFSLFGRHGFKTWLTFLLGTAIITGIVTLIWFISFIIGGILLATEITPHLVDFSLEDPESWEGLIKIAPGLIVGAILFFIITYLITLPFFSLLTSGLYSSVRENVFENRFSFGTFFSGGFSNWWRVLKQNFLYFLLFSPLVALFVLSIFFIIVDGLAIIGLLIILFLLLLTPFLLMGTLFAPAILITEKTGAFRSIATSFRLMFRSFGQVLLSFILIAGITFTLTLVLTLPVTLLTIVSDTEDSLITIFTTPYEYLVSTFVAVLSTFILFFRYHQLRPVLYPTDPGSGGTGGGTSPGGGEAIPVAQFLNKHEVQKPTLAKPTAQPAQPRKKQQTKAEQDQKGYPSSPFKAIPFPDEKPPTQK